MTPSSARGPAAHAVRCTVLLAALSFASTCVADAFVGAKVGTMNTDTPSRSDPKNAAAFVGYELDTYLADLSLVGEISRTYDSGETRQGEKLDFESNSVFLVWKTTGSLFATLRGGFSRTEVDAGSFSDDKTGLLIGASIGTVIGQTRLQIEYTSHAGEADFVGIGLEYYLPIR